MPPIVGPVKDAKNAAEGVGNGDGEGKGVIVADGDGVGGIANVPERMVVVAFLTASVDPAFTVGTVWPIIELKRRTPFRPDESLI